MGIRKYVIFGAGAAFGIAVAATTAIIASDSTAPITFRAGDVISADQLNDQFGKIKTVVEGYKSSDEIVGTWSCTSYTINNRDCAAPFVANSDGIQQGTQNVVFAAANNGYTWSAETFSPGKCAPNPLNNIPPIKEGCYVLRDDKMILGRGLSFGCGSFQGAGVYGVKRLGPNRFQWDYSEWSPQEIYTICEKQNVPPAIPTGLTSTFAGGSVTLAWTTNATDQTGFVVVRKTTLTGSYSDVGTSTGTSFSQALTTGTYWYRVRATNANGDSLGSNEVVVTVP